MLAASDDDHDEITLARLIQRYQTLAAQLRATADRAEGEAIRSLLRVQMESLWPHLQRIVRPLTWSWADRYASDFEGSRGRADVLDALSTSMSMHILDELATRAINPELSLTAFLRRIARNRMIDEHRYGQRHAPSRPATASSPTAAGLSQPTTPLPIDEELVHLYSEELSQEITSQVDDNLYRQQCWEAIRAYWAYRLRPEERVIIQERMREPATPHDEIGAMLTPPWTSVAVRKRLQRIIEDTRRHLRELELLPDDLEIGA